MKLHFITGNAGKAREAAEKLAPLGIEVEALPVPTVEIQADTLEEVARAKAEVLRPLVPRPFFVEDAGLFVDALRGFPGVYSAHAYRTLGNAGLLRLLPARTERTARFRAVIAYVADEGEPRLFAGECEGRIAPRPRGTQGFGFDPIFLPKGARKTFAELSTDGKSRISHRGRALDALAAHLPPSEKGRKR